MKIVRREGVFETNSSSVHTLVLLSKDELQADTKKDKPKYKKYRVVSSLFDKLMMACGCCHELFVEKIIPPQDGEELEDWRSEFEEDDDDDIPFLTKYDFTCDMAVALFVEEYCKRTGENVDEVKAKVTVENRSGRACHMRFFDEGALYSASSDYDVIERMFWGTTESIRRSIAAYFDDNTVLCYREYWQGMGYGDDD